LAPQSLPYLRRRAVRMLKTAQKALPTPYRLRVGTGLRTLDMQARLYWRNYQLLEQEHPSWPASALRRACNKYYAPPDAKAPPGHCTGGAVDVTLCGLDGAPLDMTSPLARWEAAYTYVENISDEAKANRNILIAAMFAAGFSNCRDEWWHWSYGDSAWAVRVGAPSACYGLIAPPHDYTHVPHPRRVRSPRLRARRRK
jgi:D-alanyl-D-alanine dipeptidase